MATTIDNSLLITDDCNNIDIYALFCNESKRFPDHNVFYKKGKNDTNPKILTYDSKCDGRLTVVFADNEWDFFYRQATERGLGIPVAVMTAGGAKVTVFDNNIKEMPSVYKDIVVAFQYDQPSLGIEVQRPFQKNIRINKLRDDQIARKKPAQNRDER